MLRKGLGGCTLGMANNLLGALPMVFSVQFYHLYGRMVQKYFGFYMIDLNETIGSVSLSGVSRGSFISKVDNLFSAVRDIQAMCIKVRTVNCYELPRSHRWKNEKKKKIQ